MPGVADKVIIDSIEIRAALEVSELLTSEIEEHNLLAEAEPFKSRFAQLCYPFLTGLRTLNRELAEFVDQRLVKTQKGGVKSGGLTPVSVDSTSAGVDQ